MFDCFKLIASFFFSSSFYNTSSFECLNDFYFSNRMLAFEGCTFLLSSTVDFSGDERIDDDSWSSLDTSFLLILFDEDCYNCFYRL